MQKKIPTSEVSTNDLNTLFDKHQIWIKIKDGQLTKKIVASDPSHSHEGGVSQIIKHLTKDGKHIATTHRILDKNKQVVHWDAKDLLVDGVRLWRRSK